MFWESKALGKVILMLEIQSSLVRATLVWFVDDSSSEPHILFSDSLNIPWKTNVDTSYFIKTTSKTLKEMLDVTMRKFYSITRDSGKSEIPKEISEVHYVLSSPWVVSQARTVTVSFKEDTTVTEDRVKAILDDERKTLTKNDEAVLEPVEEKIFQVLLNGYAVSNWRGKQAREVEMSYVLTAGSTDTIKRLTEACDHIVASGKVFFHSSLLLQYTGLRQVLAPQREDYVVIHIHGEITDVVIVERGLCSFFGSFPVGVNTIVRKIAHARNTDPRTADSLLSLYLGNRLDEEHSKEVANLMNDMAAFWNSEFNKLFKSNQYDGGLPETTLLSGHAHEDFFMRSYSAYHPTAKVEILYVHQIADNLIFDAAVDRRRMISIYALAIHTLEK